MSFAVAADNPNYKSENGLLLSKDGRTLVSGVNGCVTIPDGVTAIGAYAFFGRLGLTSVTVSASVTSIAKTAFADCGVLMSFAVAADNPNYKSENGLLLSKDGRTLIQGVNGRVTIPDGVTAIGACAFGYCSGLLSVAIPSGVTAIGANAFEHCSGLTSVTIPSSVTVIGDMAFAYCDGLTSVTIPSSVTDIGYWVFNGCTKLQNIEWQVDPAVETVEAKIPDEVDAAKVTVAVVPTVKTVRPNGAKVKVMRDGHNITAFLDIPKADASGTVDLASATVKEEIAREPLDTGKGAEIHLDDPSEPTLKTAPTKPGLVYTLREGATLDAMKDDDWTVGDGQPWTPAVTVKGGASGFYSIRVSKE